MRTSRCTLATRRDDGIVPQCRAYTRKVSRPNTHTIIQARISRFGSETISSLSADETRKCHQKLVSLSLLTRKNYRDVTEYYYDRYPVEGHAHQPLGPITRLSDQVTHSEKLRLGLQIVGNMTFIYKTNYIVKQRGVSSFKPYNWFYI